MRCRKERERERREKQLDFLFRKDHVWDSFCDGKDVRTIIANHLSFFDWNLRRLFGVIILAISTKLTLQFNSLSIPQ